MEVKNFSSFLCLREVEGLSRGNVLDKKLFGSTKEKLGKK